MALVPGPAGEHTLVAQKQLLEAVEHYGSFTKAADAVGIARATVYNWIDADKQTGLLEEDAPESSFLGKLRRAKMLAAESMLGVSFDHAMNDGGMPATIERFFHLKRWFPEYRDQLNIKHSGAVLHARVDLNQLDSSERIELLRLTQRRLELASAEPVGDAGIIDADTTPTP